MFLPPLFQVSVGHHMTQFSSRKEQLRGTSLPVSVKPGVRHKRVWEETAKLPLLRSPPGAPRTPILPQPGRVSFILIAYKTFHIRKYTKKEQGIQKHNSK